MITEKQMLTLDDIDALSTFELPARETPATVVIGCLALCVGQIRIQNVSVDVAVQICAAVEALNVTLGTFGVQLSCTIRQ